MRLKLWRPICFTDAVFMDTKVIPRPKLKSCKTGGIQNTLYNKTHSAFYSIITLEAKRVKTRVYNRHMNLKLIYKCIMVHHFLFPLMVLPVCCCRSTGCVRRWRRKLCSMIPSSSLSRDVEEVLVVLVLGKRAVM